MSISFLRIIPIALALVALGPSCAYPQGAILQAGPTTQGHTPSYANPGGVGTQAVVQDSGPAGGGGPGLGLSELNVTARGTGAGPFDGQGTGPSGTISCIQDAPTTNSAGYHYLCFSANVGGNGLITYGAGGAAPQGTLNILANGVPVGGGGGGSTFTNLFVTNQIHVGDAGPSISLFPLEIVRAGAESWYTAYEFSNDNVFFPGLIGRKSRGATIGSNVAVQSGDTTLLIRGQGNDGSANYVSSAGIDLIVDGTVSSSVVPGRIAFKTATAGGLLTEAMRIDSNQNVNIGDQGAEISAFPLELVRAGAESWLVSYEFSNDNVFFPGILGRKSRGTSIGSSVAVQNGDTTLLIRGQGNDGTASYVSSSGIDLIVDGSVSSGVVPGRIAFKTATAGGVLTEAMRIDSNQNVNIGDQGASISLFPLEVVRVGAESWSVFYEFSNDNTFFPGWIGRKSRGATVGSNVAVQSGDNTAIFRGQGNDGSANYVSSAGIDFTVDGSVSSGIVPGRMSFKTANSSGTLGEALRIDSSGHMFFYLLATTPGSKQPLCIDTSTHQVYAGTGSAC